MRQIRLYQIFKSYSLPFDSLWFSKDQKDLLIYHFPELQIQTTDAIGFSDRKKSHNPKCNLPAAQNHGFIPILYFLFITLSATFIMVLKGPHVFFNPTLMSFKEKSIFLNRIYELLFCRSLCQGLVCLLILENGQ